MIEIVFSDSACGSLKIAQRFGGGNSSDIFGFNLSLSIGDISEQEIFKRSNTALEMVQKRISAGEPIRIWYSNQPDEMCGLFWFMWLLDHWNADSEKIFIVKLPEWEADENGNIIRKNSFSEVAPEEWSRYLDLQKPVLPLFITACSLHWQTLKEENAPLRAILNGILVSVSECLYDDLIHREIAAENETFRESMIIGRILGKYQFGISDFWVAYRIEEMIHAGLLEVVPSDIEDKRSYSRMLKKV